MYFRARDVEHISGGNLPSNRISGQKAFSTPRLQTTTGANSGTAKTSNDHTVVVQRFLQKQIGYSYSVVTVNGLVKVLAFNVHVYHLISLLRCNE